LCANFSGQAPTSHKLQLGAVICTTLKMKILLRLRCCTLGWHSVKYKSMQSGSMSGRIMEKNLTTMALQVSQWMTSWRHISTYTGKCVALFSFLRSVGLENMSEPSAALSSSPALTANNSTSSGWLGSLFTPSFFMNTSFDLVWIVMSKRLVCKSCKLCT